MKTKTFTLLSSLTLLLALFLGTAEVKADELTVTSTTSKTYTENTPLAGNLIGSTLIKTEYIISNTKLTALKGKNITKMSLTLNAATTTWGDAEFQVFLKEVTTSNYPSPVVLLGNEGATTVYEGSLDPTKSTLDITFTTPFNYSNDGNNLLVGIYCTKVGTAASLYFKLIRENTSDYNYYSGYTNNASGSLTRTNWYPETTFTYQDAVVVTPILSVSANAIDFGSMRASDKQTVTVTNSGVGSMDVTISSDNTTDFTLSATSLTGIGAGESKTFDVTFNYNIENLGEKTANITVTPSYNAEDAKAIVATATAADPNVWEDFSEGIPATWFNENDSWLNYVSGLSGYASPGYNSNDVLRTPRLYAEEGQALGFDVKIVDKYSSNKITAKYSTDRVTWSTPVDYAAPDGFGASKDNPFMGTYSIVAPATGYYWVEFTGSQAGIDNITGWSLAPISHETKLGKATIPATGTAHGTYTASVVVQELGGSDETVTAELYFGANKVAEQTGIAISGNSDKTIELSYLPTEEFEGNVYIKVSGENIGELETDPVNVTISETTYVFDEDSDDNPVISTNSVVKVKYTAQKGWNTIVMPFSLTGSPAYMNTIFGEGWTAYAIYSYEGGEISFNSATYMAPSIPYLVYAPNAESHPEGVYLQSVTAGSFYWNKSTAVTTGDATFIGTFKPIAAPNMEGKYGITDEGKLAKGTNEASIKAYHAYLEVTGAAPSRIVIEGFEEEDLPTDLNFVKLVDANAKAIYTLSGQKVEKAKKGIYIVNGKKIVVR